MDDSCSIGHCTRSNILQPFKFINEYHSLWCFCYVLFFFYLPVWLGSNSDKCFCLFFSLFFFFFFLFYFIGVVQLLFLYCFGWCSSPMFSRRAVANDGEADAENGTSGLRRACSLSDLSKPSPRRLLPSPPNNGITSIQFFFVFVFFSNCSAFFGIKTQWVKLKFWFPGDILEVSIVFFFFVSFIVKYFVSVLWRVVESSQLTLNCFRM